MNTATTSTLTSIKATIDGYEATVRKMVFKCTEAGKSRVQMNAMLGILEPMHLYYRRSTEFVNGDLLLVPDGDSAPTGYELATGEGLRCDVPYDRYFNWVITRVSRLHILAWGRK